MSDNTIRESNVSNTTELALDPERPHWAILPLDQSVALRTASTRLSHDFDGIYGTETIERFLHSSFDQFADRASIPTFLPLMAERFARQRLRALAGFSRAGAAGGSFPV